MSGTGKTDLQALKHRVDKTPFTKRLKFDGGGFTACPFHVGESRTSAHLVQKDGSWILTCFSSCGKSWDAINFVKEFDKVEFGECRKRTTYRRTEGNPDDCERVAAVG